MASHRYALEIAIRVNPRMEPTGSATYKLKLSGNTGGDENTAVGFQALLNNTTGTDNTAIGTSALKQNIDGGGNAAMGYRALEINTSGGANIAIGYQALSLNTSGNNNIAIGVNAGDGVRTASSVISIGNAGSNISGSCFIGNIRGITTAQNDAVPVFIRLSRPARHDEFLSAIQEGHPSNGQKQRRDPGA